MSTKKEDDFVVSVPDGTHEMEKLDGDQKPRSPFSPASSRQHAEPASPLSALANNPTASILGYCLASISMTVVNKFVVSGSDWNLMFLYLAIQVGPASGFGFAESEGLMLCSQLSALLQFSCASS